MAITRPCVLYNVSGRLVPYVEAWRWQKMLVRKAMDAQRAGLPSRDALLVVEHSSVYTLGRGSKVDNVKFDPRAADCPHAVYRIERGGEVTWHGPGQVVAYPILDLTRAPHHKDLHWYWHTLEGAAIDCLAGLGLSGERDAAGTGVWVGGRKVAALGLTASRWITMHGLSLNADPDLEVGFGRIVPCGIVGRGVTSVARELRRQRGCEAESAGLGGAAAAGSRGDEDANGAAAAARAAAVADVRRRLVGSLAQAFALELQAPDLGPAGPDLESDLGSEGPGLGTPGCDDAHLSDAAWLAKHQRPV